MSKPSNTGAPAPATRQQLHKVTLAQTVLSSLVVGAATEAEAIDIATHALLDDRVLPSFRKVAPWCHDWGPVAVHAVKSQIIQGDRS